MENLGFALVDISLSEFVSAEPSSLVGELTKGLSNSFADVSALQVKSWVMQIEVLQEAVEAAIESSPRLKVGRILLEYSIPVLRRRLDAVLVLPEQIIVIEYKSGGSTSAGTALKQAESYVDDITYFHEPSRDLKVTPLAVGNFEPGQLKGSLEERQSVNFKELKPKLLRLIFDCGGLEHVDVEGWSKGRYFPVPSVIDAAVSAFNGHSVSDIACSKADQFSLDKTSRVLTKAVQSARESGSKIICILTGVPGAGKTLAGLNAVSEVTQSLDLESEQAVYLSGNSPLVNVLREALYRDRKPSHPKTTKKSLEPLIQEMHRFVADTYATNLPPSAKMIVFDEAQRAWTRERNYSKFGRNISEPEMVLEVMSRHHDWAVVVALVGGGQEIHSGEAGLEEWGRALIVNDDWEIWSSPVALDGGPAVAGTRLFEPNTTRRVHKEVDLHLSVSVRSLESENTSAWVNSVLAGDVDRAKTLAEPGLPIYVCRSIGSCRQWLDQRKFGTSRVGLVASSRAARSRAIGVEQPTFGFLQGIDYVRWFLDPDGDVRSSFQLEVAMSEFEIQGLELDYVGLVWDGDLVFRGSLAQIRKFTGGQWKDISPTNPKNSQSEKEGLNRYRVLLTRFRKGMVICVPYGNDEDPTRSPSDYTSIFDHLINCGATSID